MRAWWRRIRPEFLATCAYIVTRLIGFTLRTRCVNEERLSANGKGKIIAGWHGRSFLPPLIWRNRGFWILISQSADGEILARLFKKFGFNTIRGSTARGGARAAVACAKLLREGNVLVVSPDGPRGPREIVQMGLIRIAQHGDAEIVPAGAAAKPCKIINSWDKYMIPLPFARGAIFLAEPITVPRNVADDELESNRQKAEKDISAALKLAETEVGL